MTIFTAIVEDRHTDTRVYLFTREGDAVAFAQKVAADSAHDKSDIEEKLNNEMKKAGWLYYARYSCEGDSVRVVPCELDAAL